MAKAATRASQGKSAAGGGAVPPAGGERGHFPEPGGVPARRVRQARDEPLQPGLGTVVPEVVADDGVVRPEQVLAEIAEEMEVAEVDRNAVQFGGEGREEAPGHVAAHGGRPPEPGDERPEEGGGLGLAFGGDLRVQQD